MSELRAPHFMRYSKRIAAPVDTVISLSPKVVELALDLAGRYSIADLAEVSPLPAESCWIELPGDVLILKHYVRAFAVGSGRVLVVHEENLADPETLATVFKLQSPGCGAVELELSPDVPVPLSREVVETKQTIERHTGAMFTAICAMMAVPGVSSTEEKRREKRLQRRQGQAAPLITYRCIDVNIDALADIPVVSSGSGEAGGGGVARHHVRGHLRLTEKKGLVPVRPHWRGDVRYGLRLRDRNVMRDEEMH